MNNYTKLLADLGNVEEVIKDEDKTLILLSSLMNDEYGTFILILINGKEPLSYNEVSATLLNHELRKNDRHSSISTSTEVSATGGIGSNH